MALLVFDDAALNSESSKLLDISHRQKIATELNAAILTSFSQDKDPKLPGMLKMLKWAQEQLDEKVQFPKITNFSTAEFEIPMDV